MGSSRLLGGIGNPPCGPVPYKLLQKTFEERVGNPEVEVALGVKVKEGVEVSGTWSDSKVYMPYPDTDSAKNPNL